ncbi:exported hypothetical protein [Frankia sp. Hr75.2]|nr:exported hypothetical protein [Frankia sp. Hr75.2]SQE00195.1 exported hypothetical protein [Parafrankia sp. Ea1.12]
MMCVRKALVCVMTAGVLGVGTPTAFAASTGLDAATAERIINDAQVAALDYTGGGHVQSVSLDPDYVTVSVLKLDGDEATITMNRDYSIQSVYIS